jgi:lipoate-protein ligase A
MNDRIRLIVHEAQNRYRNMAIDEALLKFCYQPVIRFYQWTDSAVSLGYFQKTTEVPQGREFVRRYTGGGLVDHASDFTYSIVLPKGHPLYEMGTQASYEAIHQAVAQALVDSGFSASLAQEADEQPHEACFQRAVKSDVIDGGKKLAGAAQRRTKTACLHQGSILLGKSDAKYFRLLCGSLSNRFSVLFDGILVNSALTPEEEELALQLETEKYSTSKWNESN